MKLNSLFKTFTKTDFLLWFSSIGIIVVSFCIFDRKGFLALAASLLGTTSLIFCAKGNPLGQLIMIVFSGIYGYISFGFSYYGEMLTYLGMTAPMALISLISWVRNPFHGESSEVRVNTIPPVEIMLIPFMTAAVTFIFYFILKHFHTANLLPSTISVATSFAYALNDIVLIILWSMAAMQDISSLSVLICFAMFLINDIYGFISWQKMKKRQRQN